MGRSACPINRCKLMKSTPLRRYSRANARRKMCKHGSGTPGQKLKSLPGWAVSQRDLTQARRMGLRRLLIIDEGTGHTYENSIEYLDRANRRINRRVKGNKTELQVMLPHAYWVIDGRPAEKVIRGHE